MLTEIDAASKVLALQQTRQPRLALQQRQAAQILSIEIEQVENIIL